MLPSAFCLLIGFEFFCPTPAFGQMGGGLLDVTATVTDLQPPNNVMPPLTKNVVHDFSADVDIKNNEMGKTVKAVSTVTVERWSNGLQKWVTKKEEEDDVLIGPGDTKSTAPAGIWTPTAGSYRVFTSTKVREWNGTAPVGPEIEIGQKVNYFSVQ